MQNIFVASQGALHKKKGDKNKKKQKVSTASLPTSTSSLDFGADVL